MVENEDYYTRILLYYRNHYKMMSSFNNGSEWLIEQQWCWVDDGLGGYDNVSSWL